MQQPTWSSPVQTPQTPQTPPPTPGNGAATAALILGILSLFVSVGIFALVQSVGRDYSSNYVAQAWVLLLIGSVPALPAIICGQVGLARARISNGLRGGEGRAITGVVFGYFFYVGLIILLLMVLITAPKS